MELKDKIVLISGATGGLGKELVRGMAGYAEKIILLARNKDKVLELIEGYEPGKFDYFLVDLSNRKELLSVCKKIKKRYGRIDILINNAAVGTHKSFLGSSLDDLWYMQEMTLNAHLLLTYELFPLMTDGGKVVNIGSVAEAISLPIMGNYSMAKSALYTFSNVLRMEAKERGMTVLHVTLGPLENENFNANMLSGSKGVSKSKKTSLSYASGKIISAMKKDKSRIIVPWFYSSIICFDFLFRSISDALKVKFFKSR
ncbi:MAG: SDR family NAD(P)-dependent oxidoreductase [Candidatus Woesearchaeota archaeon]|nr:SDR family NAD(P)-dependent oxidoreductase [Candidatus Woesearchaeota archaeon]